MPPLLPDDEHITPYDSQFAGFITADGQTARVASLALSTQGRVALLSLVGGDTTLSAICARLFKGEQLMFAARDELRWDAPNLFGRADQVSYRQIKAAIPHTREKNYLVLPHTADIGEGLVRPEAVEAPTATTATGSAATPPARPSRFVFANSGAAAPHPRSFLGHLRALRVVFLPHWASQLWQEGLDAHLITPLPSLGIRAWELASDQARWQQLVSDAVRAGRLTRHTTALAA